MGIISQLMNKSEVRKIEYHPFTEIKLEYRKKGIRVVHNPTDYPLIGKGFAGAVFKISPIACVKLFLSSEEAAREIETLKAVQGSKIIPTLLNYGSNYIVMEYVEGLDLKTYFTEEQEVSKEVTKAILGVLDEMKRLKFTRLDIHLRHMIITSTGDIKVIDHGNSFVKTRSKPILLFKGLEKQGLIHSFLEQVKELDPDQYTQWINDRQLTRFL